MAHQPINHGSAAGDGQGENLFNAFTKVNANDAELFGAKTVFVANYAALPVTGEVGKIYVTQDDDAMYRWTGSAYDDLGGIQFVANAAALPATGEALKLYVTLDTGVQYRWTGSVYLNLTPPSTLQSGGRPTLLVFGNSIGGQSSRFVASTTAYSSAEARAGASVIQVPDATLFSINDKIIIGLGFQGFHKATVTATDTAPTPDTITITPALPYLARVSAPILKYTTVEPNGIRMGSGAISTAVAMLGGSVDVIPGYGFGGALARQMLLDLPLWLRYYRPSYVAFHLLENDAAASTSLASMQASIRTAAEMCVRNGATPLFFSSMPSSSIINSRIDEYDAMLTYVLNIGNVVPGARGFNLSTPWLDTAQPTLRPPLAGWTDGVHPNANKRMTIGDMVAAMLSPIIGSRSTLADIALDSYDMSGTGGTATNLVGGSVVAANTTVSADAGVTATASKTADDKQRVVFSVAGASNVSSTTAKVRKLSNALPTNVGGQMAKGYAIIKINALTNVSMLYPYITFSPGFETYSAWQDSDVMTDPAMVGKTLTIETSAVRIPNGATSYDIDVWMRPQTLGSPSGVSGDFEVLEMGLLLSPAGEINPALGT